MATLIIINDTPYGSERAYNALRFATALENAQPGTGMTVFLMADAVAAATVGQKVRDSGLALSGC